MSNLKSKKKKSIYFKTAFLLLAGMLLTFGAAGTVYAVQTEPELLGKEEYMARFEKAIALADLIRQSECYVVNKTYTQEQEVELKAWTEKNGANDGTDFGVAFQLLGGIWETLEPGEFQPTLNAWDTLIDGDSMIESSKYENGKQSKLSHPKKQVGEQVYCFTFYDVCRLEGIPCFILEDVRDYPRKVKYRCMVYVHLGDDTEEGEWLFVDADDEKRDEYGDMHPSFIPAEQLYTAFGEEFCPTDLMLDYRYRAQMQSEIYLSQEMYQAYEDSSASLSMFNIYDSEKNTVTAHYPSGRPALGEQYWHTVNVTGENGETPNGWVDISWYETTYDIDSKPVNYHVMHKGYCLYGIFLRGRITVDGQEYELASGESYWNNIPYSYEVKRELQSAEHAAKVKGLAERLQGKVIRCAEALVNDPDFVWDDTDFTDEDRALVQAAVDEALDWDYMSADRWSGLFQKAGVDLAKEDPQNLSDRAKAQAILNWIKDHIQPVEHGQWYVNSASVIRTGEAICGGMSLLYRDMCVMAGVPCFRLGSSMHMYEGDSLLGNHGNNVLRVGEGEWVFSDPMNMPLIGQGGYFPTMFLSGYTTLTLNVGTYMIDYEANCIDRAWLDVLDNADQYYYDFDEDGKLGVYRRDYQNQPVVTAGYTDENGRLIKENGFHELIHTVDSEDGKEVVENLYVYYYQYGRYISGENTIKGIKYRLTESVWSAEEGRLDCQWVKELRRWKKLSGLTILPIEDQPYAPGGAEPVPEIYDGEKKLELNRDFVIKEYRSNTLLSNEGVQAHYVAQGIGDYIGEITRDFRIVKADISNLDVKLSCESYSWQLKGKNDAFQPEVTVDIPVGEYDINYFDCYDVGTARVVITGRNHYTGRIEKEYEIKPYLLDTDTFWIGDFYKKPLQDQEFAYHAKTKTEPKVRIYYTDEDGQPSSITADLDVTYENTDRPGTAQVTVSTNGNFVGVLSCTYQILPYDIGDNSGVQELLRLGRDAFGPKRPQYSYTGEAVSPPIPDFGELVEGVDYTLEYKDNVQIGTATVTVQGIGNCTGTYQLQYDICPLVLAYTEVSLSFYYANYDGKVQKPAVKVSDESLAEGKDYTVIYQKKIGDAYVESEDFRLPGDYRILVKAAEHVVLSPSYIAPEFPSCYVYDFKINRSSLNDYEEFLDKIQGGSQGTGGQTAAPSTGSQSPAGGVQSESGTPTGSGNSETGSGSEAQTGDGDSRSETEQGKADEQAAEIEKPKVVKLSSLKAKSCAFVAKWKKPKTKLSGYELQYTTNKKFAKNCRIKKIKKASTGITVKKLKKKKTYYVRIRSYLKKDGKYYYSAWSKAKSVKTK